MSFGHNSKYMQNFPHLTRWVAPIPQDTPSIMLTPPINISIDKTKKRSKCHRYLSLSPILQTPRCINLHDGSPKHSASFYQFSSLKPYPIRSYTHSSNFGSHPFTKLKMHPHYSHISYHSIPPHILVCKISPLKD